MSIRTILFLLLFFGCGKGPKGDQGPIGIPGTSCTTAPIEGGALITCTDGTSAEILNGVDGEPGRVIQCNEHGNCNHDD